MAEETTSKRSVLPTVLLAAGVISGIGAAVAAQMDLNALAVTLGSGAAIFAIWLTFIIARRQDAETETLTGVIEQMHELLKQSTELIRELAERRSAEDYDVSPAELQTIDSASDAEGPSYRAEAIEALRARGAKLDFNNLVWRAKKPAQDMPGNHGWFVESRDGRGGRWFVRKARGMTVRKAMPREFLDFLEKEQLVGPRDIRLDFQTTEHGLAAWYARTYSGDLWKVWRPNRTRGDGIQAEKVEGT